MRMGPTTSRRAWTGAVAVVLVVAGVAGCSGGGAEPTPTRSPTSASPTASPTPTVSATPDASVKPERPAAMDEVDSAGAEAVAVYFLELFPYIFASGDLTVWKALSHPDCVYCANVTAGVKEMHADGNRSQGGLVVASAVTSTETDPGRWWLVSLTLREQPSSTVDADGKIVEKFADTKTYKTDVAVVRESGRWFVREVTHTRQG